MWVRARDGDRDRDREDMPRWRCVCLWMGRVAAVCLATASAAALVYYLAEVSGLGIETPAEWLRSLERSPKSAAWPTLAALLVVVSFPVALGYLPLVLCSGYLLGFPLGMSATVVGANCGVALAHFGLRLLGSRSAARRLLERDSAAALFRVISGPQSIKIVFFARLTPIPFGLQNAVFALSDVGGIRYHLASAAGLLPAQVINVYLGSTLRSIRDVIQHSHVAGYVVFGFQIAIGIGLMVWIVRRARRELTKALLDLEAGREGILSASSSSSSLC